MGVEPVEEEQRLPMTNNAQLQEEKTKSDSNSESQSQMNKDEESRTIQGSAGKRISQSRRSSNNRRKQRPSEKGLTNDTGNNGAGAKADQLSSPSLIPFSVPGSKEACQEVVEAIQLGESIAKKAPLRENPLRVYVLLFCISWFLLLCFNCLLFLISAETLLLLMPQLHFDAASLGSSARFRRSRLGLTNGWNDWHGETDVLWLLIQ